MGYCPDWYEVLRAAKYLRTTPWELQNQPHAWQVIALLAAQAEGEAREQKQSSAERRAKVK